MSALITGGGGYIGSALAKRLLEEGYEVITIDDLSRGNYEHLRRVDEGARLKLVVGDIRDVDKLNAVVKNVGDLKAIFHLAAVSGLRRCSRDPRKAITTNVYGSYNVLEIARKYDADKIIFTSSAAVYGDPIELPIPESHPTRPKNLYGITKLAAEHLFISYHELYGLTTVILRLGNVYGVGLFTYWESVIPKFVRQALSGKPLTIYGTGEQTRDFVHVWDVVRALELVLKANNDVVSGEVFNVASGHPISVNFIAEIVRENVGKIGVVHLPPREGETYLPGFCLSIDKIRRKLGFEPSWDVKEGIKQLIKYYLSSSMSSDQKERRT